MIGVSYVDRRLEPTTILIVFVIFFSVLGSLSQSWAEPQSLINCKVYRDQSVQLLETRLTLESEGMVQVADSVDMNRWIPRSPQLRGRVNQDQRSGQARSWSSRVGTRLYLPALTSDPSVDSIAGLSLSELPLAWLKAKQRQESKRVSELHISAREAWVELKVAQERAAIQKTRHQLSLRLSGAGALPARVLKQVELQRELAEMDADQALHDWVSINSLMTLNNSADNRKYHRDPLQSVCIAHPVTQSEWNQILHQPRAHLASEIELLMKLNYQRLSQSRRRGRWLDFVEVSYDEQDGDGRWIAEVGLDLVPLDTGNSADQLELHKLQSSLQTLKDEAVQHEIRLSTQLSMIRAHQKPQRELKRPQLIQLPDLDLYELEVSVWQKRWRRYLSIERVLIQWWATHTAL